MSSIWLINGINYSKDKNCFITLKYQYIVKHKRLRNCLYFHSNTLKRHSIQFSILKSSNNITFFHWIPCIIVFVSHHAFGCATYDIKIIKGMNLSKYISIMSSFKHIIGFSLVCPFVFVLIDFTPFLGEPFKWKVKILSLLGEGSKRKKIIFYPFLGQKNRCNKRELVFKYLILSHWT